MITASSGLAINDYIGYDMKLREHNAKVPNKVYG